MQKLQSQGVHHITIVGADRQTSIDFWEGVLGMPFVFEQPNLDNEAESHLYFDPGDGRLITVFTNEERDARPAPHADRPGLRAPHRVLALAGHLRAGGGAARRARHPPQRREGPRVHGLDLLHRPARPADRARVVPLRAAVRLHALRRAARGAQAPRGARRLQHRARCTSPTRSRSSCGGRGRRCRTTARRRTPTTTLTAEDHMAAHTLNVLKPSVNNLTVRIFVRAAGLDFEEDGRLGQDRRGRVPRQEPLAPDADDRGGGPAARRPVGELRDHAVPLQQARARPVLSRPTRPRARWWTARCST